MLYIYFIILMINNSIDFDQNNSQLYNVSKTGCSSLFEEPTANNELANDIEQHEKEIPIKGFPNEIEEIKINQMPEDVPDVPFENFVKATSEIEKSFKFEFPVPPGAPEAKELNENLYKFLPFAVVMSAKEHIENEKKGIKKIQFNSINDYHQAFSEFVKNHKNNDPKQTQNLIKDLFETFDLLPYFATLYSYHKCNEKINKNPKEDEKENTISFEDLNTEDSQENKIYNKGHLFM